jgi:hypothetical protein
MTIDQLACCYFDNQRGIPRIMVSYLPNSLLIVAENDKTCKHFLYVSIKRLQKEATGREI